MQRPVFWQKHALLLMALVFTFLLHAQQTITDSAVVVFGDTRSNPQIHRSIVKTIMRYKPAAVFETGDLVFNGRSRSNWELFKEIMKPILDSSRFYPVFGNHELKAPTMASDFNIPNNGKWYSVSLRGVKYIVLDNFSSYKPGSDQYKWLEQQLASCRPETFRVILMHLPVYSSGPHQTSVRKLRKYLVPLFDRYGADIVFSAHNHCYERAQRGKTYYITTAGGGAPLYPKIRNIPESQLFIKAHHICILTTSNHCLTLTAVDSIHQVIDRFGIVR